MNKSKKLNSQFSAYKKVLVDFVQNIEGINFSVPRLMGCMGEEAKKFNTTFKSFLKKNGRVLKNKKYAIKIEEIEKLEELLRKQNHIKIAVDSIPKSFLVTMVGYLDNHLKEILKVLFKNREDLLNNTEKNISLSELFELDSFLEAKRYVIDREIDQILESRVKYFNWIESRLNIKLNFDPLVFSRLIELTERRNLFVHSGGVVDKKYLEVCKKSKIVNPKVKVGDRLTLSPRYFFESFSIIYIVGVQLFYQVCRQLETEIKEEIESDLLTTTADLMTRNQNLTSLKLSEFGANLELSSEELRLMFLINRSLALKFMGKQEEAEKLVSSHDWSASSDRFKLAVAIIKDKDAEAINIMERIGNKSDMKEAYHNWPLFKKFGTTKKFAATYKKIFGTSYIEKKIA